MDDINLEQEKFVEKSDLDLIKELKDKLQVLHLSLKNAELEYQNTVLKIFVKNNLSQDDSFDEVTGKITKK